MFSYAAEVYIFPSRHAQDVAFRGRMEPDVAVFLAESKKLSGILKVEYSILKSYIGCYECAIVVSLSFVSCCSRRTMPMTD